MFAMRWKLCVTGDLCPLFAMESIGAREDSLQCYAGQLALALSAEPDVFLSGSFSIAVGFHETRGFGRSHGNWRGSTLGDAGQRGSARAARCVAVGAGGWRWSSLGRIGCGGRKSRQETAAAQKKEEEGSERTTEVSVREKVFVCISVLVCVFMQITVSLLLDSYQVCNEF